MKQLKVRILESEQAKQLVSDNFSASLVIIELTGINPSTGQHRDYSTVASQLNNLVRKNFDSGAYSVKIIGYAELIGEIKSAIDQTAWFFLASFFCVLIILTIALKNPWLALLPIASTLVAVTLLLGTLSVFNIQMHPFGIFVPFLIFAIGTSHGLQLIQSLKNQLNSGVEFETAIIQSHSTLLMPGIIALLSDCIGFVTILFIDIPVNQDMAIAASLGVALLILSNLFLLPVFLPIFKKAYYTKSSFRKHKPIFKNGCHLISLTTGTRGSISIILAVQIC